MRPVNQVQVEVVTQIGRIEHLVWLLGYLSDDLLHLGGLVLTLQINQLIDRLDADVLAELLLVVIRFLKFEQLGPKDVSLATTAIHVVEVLGELLDVAVLVFLHQTEGTLDGRIS
ncbi:MAG: hypothetical protein ACMG6E_07510 [Candidatus Roizmanbacteria bacterium]